MTIYGLDLWAAALIFARLGAILMLLPGFGEPAVPVRARLGFALAFTVCLMPALSPQIPEMPADVMRGMGAVIGEVLIGLMIGAAGRMLMSALATAGNILGLESGLAFATTADPTSDNSGQTFAVFLGLMGIVLIFATDLHHLLLRGAAGSYGIFTPGGTLPVGDAAALMVTMMSKAFLVGFQIAAPLIAAGIVFRLGMGALARLIPTIQVFFVALPLQMLGSFIIIALGLSTGMLVWLNSMDDYTRSLQ